MWSSINSQNNRERNQGILHLWSKFHGPSLNRWWVITRKSSKWGKFWLWSSRSITPKNNRDLYQGLLHLWSKFGDPSLNGWWVIARTSKCLPHTRTDGHTVKSNQISLLPYIHTWRYSVQQIWTPHIWQRGMKEALLIGPSIIKILKIIYRAMMP